MTAVLAKRPFRLVRGPGPQGKEKQYEYQQFYVTEGQKRYEQKAGQRAEGPGGLWQVADKAKRCDMSGEVPDNISLSNNSPAPS